MCNWSIQYFSLSFLWVVLSLEAGFTDINSMIVVKGIVPAGAQVIQCSKVIVCSVIQLLCGDVVLYLKRQGK